MKSHLLTFLAVTIVGGFLIGFGCTGTNEDKEYGTIYISSLQNPSNQNGPYLEGERLKFLAVPPSLISDIISYDWDIEFDDAAATPNTAASFAVNAASPDTTKECTGGDNSIPSGNRCCSVPSEPKIIIICTAPISPTADPARKSYTVKVTIKRNGTDVIWPISTTYLIQKPPTPPSPPPPQALFTVRSDEESWWDTSDVQRKENTFFKGEMLRIEAGTNGHTLDLKWEFEPAVNSDSLIYNEEKSSATFWPQTLGPQKIILKVTEISAAEPKPEGRLEQTINIVYDKYMNCEPPSDRCGPITYSDPTRPPLAADLTVRAIEASRTDIIPGEEIVYSSTSTGSNIRQYELSRFAYPANLHYNASYGRYEGLEYKGVGYTYTTGRAPRERGPYITCMRITDELGNRSTRCKRISIGNLYADFEMGYTNALAGVTFNRRPQNIFAVNDILKFRNLSQCRGGQQGACTYRWLFRGFTPNAWLSSSPYYDPNFQLNGETVPKFDGEIPPEFTASGSGSITLVITEVATGTTHQKDVSFTIGNPIVHVVGLEANGERTNTCPTTDSINRKRYTAGSNIQLKMLPGILSGEIDPNTGEIVAGGGDIRNITWQLGCRFFDENGRVLLEGERCRTTPELQPPCNFTDAACIEKNLSFEATGQYKISVSAQSPSRSETSCAFFFDVTPRPVPTISTDFTLQSVGPQGVTFTTGTSTNPAYTLRANHYIPVSLTLKAQEASGGTGPYTYTWTVVGRTPVSRQDRDHIIEVDMGVTSVTVQLAVTDSSGLSLATIEKTIAINRYLE